MKEDKFKLENQYFKLDKDNNVIPCTLYEWGEFLEEARTNGKKIVKQEEVKGKFISTVFLGLNHNFYKGGPLIFETMVFEEGKDGGPLGYEIYCERYSTWKEAEEGHIKAIEWVNNGCKDEEALNSDV